VDILLTTEHLTLRRFTAADVDELVVLYQDPEVVRYITGGTPIPREVVETETLPRFLSYYRRFSHLGYWAAEERVNGAFVGWFELVPVEDDHPEEVELGYRLARWAWGHGYATEGCRALVRLAFTDLGVQRIVATTMVINAASRRVLEKAGLHYVDTVHKAFDDPIDGAEHGDVDYALDRADWDHC